MASRDPGRGARGPQPQVRHVRRRRGSALASPLVSDWYPRAEQGPRPLRAAQVPQVFALR